MVELSGFENERSAAPILEWGIGGRGSVWKKFQALFGMEIQCSFSRSTFASGDIV